MEAVHEDGPDDGPGGDAVFLQVSSRPTNNTMASSFYFCKVFLKLDKIFKCGRSISIGKQEIFTPKR